ncbi:transcriptional activator protein LysR [Klebsiella michiganensis]|nr:transcriptional activator protein LysR [Klebsiella michiganensis]
MPAVNLRHIEIFHAVMTTGNLTEAARMLHTSQPTVSRELARFEKVLGLTLFSRTRGRLQPTVQDYVCLKRCSDPGTVWTESSAPQKACASSARASCR